MSLGHAIHKLISVANLTPSVIERAIADVEAEFEKLFHHHVAAAAAPAPAAAPEAHPAPAAEPAPAPAPAA